MNDIIGRSSASLDGFCRGEEEGLIFRSPVGTPREFGPRVSVVPPWGVAVPTDTAGVEILAPTVGVSRFFSRGRNSHRCRGKSSTKSLGLRVSCVMITAYFQLKFNMHTYILYQGFLECESV